MRSWAPVAAVRWRFDQACTRGTLHIMQRERSLQQAVADAHQSQSFLVSEVLQGLGEVQTAMARVSETPSPRAQTPPPPAAGTTKGGGVESRLSSLEGALLSTGTCRMLHFQLRVAPFNCVIMSGSSCMADCAQGEDYVSCRVCCQRFQTSCRQHRPPSWKACLLR